jgi:hypothetical protein
MDIHLRSYFSGNTMQLDIDTTLLSKVLESTDGPVAKKVFDMGISPNAIFRFW